MLTLHSRTLAICLIALVACTKTELRQPEPARAAKGGGGGGGKAFKRQTLTDSRGFTEYRTGNFPLILSAPHGGTLKPADLPDRTCAECVTGGDLNTRQLLQLVDSFIIVKTACYPHAVFTNLHRSKLDANRSLPEATDGNNETLPFYEAYHNYLGTAQQTLMQKSTRGLLIDLHGHGHSIQRLELGYDISSTSLRLDDASLATKQNQSSIRRLSTIALDAPGFVGLIRGETSLGTYIGTLGYPAVPSSQIPYPLEGEDYFNGGFITETYGSEINNTTDAIQIECNYTGVRDTYDNRVAFADALTDALLQYLRHYFSGEPNTWCK